MPRLTYQRHKARWRNCKGCPLGDQRRRICLARGKVPCDVLFIGEAPGVSEDSLGVPFVGPAGKLLDYIVDRALDGQYDYALTNLVACFPKKSKEAGINEPSTDEIVACGPRLREFGFLARPKVVILVGKLASKNIPGSSWFREDDEPLEAPWVPRGQHLSFGEIMHPAGILRLDVSQRGLAIQRTVVTIQDVVEKSR